MQSFFSSSDDVWVRKLRVVKNDSPIKAIVDITVKGVDIDGFMIILSKWKLQVCSPAARYIFNGKEYYKQVVKLNVELEKIVYQQILLAFRRKHL